MTSISPPAKKIWWKEPIEKGELIWIAVVVVWGIILTLMMPFWHIYGDKYTVRTEGDMQVPVVKPPAGEDIYLVGRLWQWWPYFELKKDETYRLHIASIDWQHGFSLQPTNLNVQVLPGYDMVLTVTPNKTGKHTIVCNEYCGIGHHNMLGTIYVVE